MPGLTYSRKNIVRTLATGFVLGSIVLSIGGIVVILGMTAFGVAPLSLGTMVGTVSWGLVLTLAAGVFLGWIVRLGLGIHAYWEYKRNASTMVVELPAKSAQKTTELTH